MRKRRVKAIAARTIDEAQAQSRAYNHQRTRKWKATQRRQMLRMRGILEEANA